MILDVKNLSISYWDKKGYVKALSAVNFRLAKGKILGVVGESGSGKSTLAYSILNLLPPDAKREGEIIFKGKNIFSLSENELESIRGRKISLIFQEPASTFNPVLSIDYQFKEVLGNKMGVKNKNNQEEIIFDSFKKVKLQDRERILKSYPHQLSGGQLQRIAIAMALACKPDILIADEPTSSLDVTIESQVIHLFKELKYKLNLTIIFITHNLDLARILSEEIAVLYGGEVREINNKEKMFSSPQDSYTKSLLNSFKELEG